MSAVRTTSLIRHELETALRYRDEASRDAKYANDPLVRLMFEQNDAEIERLEAELRNAVAADLEVSIEGSPVFQHVVTVPYFHRILDNLQSAYRALLRSHLPDGRRLSAKESILMLAGTGLGSFRAFLKVPGQGELIGDSRPDEAMTELIRIASSSKGADDTDYLREWAQRADDKALRAMIRLMVTLASSGGSTAIRYATMSGAEHHVTVSATDARSIVAALVGGAGVEILQVSGYLEMAQDRPLKARITSNEDVWSATVPDELRETVRDLLFEDVDVVLQVHMRTSAQTGNPTQAVTVLSITAATSNTST